jgi:hypothetical protein
MFHLTYRFGRIRFIRCKRRKVATSKHLCCFFSFLLFLLFLIIIININTL